MAIQIWIARLDRPLTDREEQALLHRIPPARKERLLRVQDTAMRGEVLCAYGLLLAALYETYGWTALPEIALNGTGKPYFSAYPHVYFNLSHTTGAVMVAVGDAAVGVDIEKVRPVSQRMLERIRPDATPEQFYRHWVRQEARAKCSGNGIGEFLHGEPPEREGERYLEIDALPGYAAGIALSGQTEQGETRLLVWSRDLSNKGVLWGGND